MFLHETLFTFHYSLLTILIKPLGKRQRVDQAIETPQNSKKHINRLKIVAALLTVIGIGLFSYFVYAVGVHEIYHGVLRFGVVGFAVILGIFFVRICIRAYA